MRPRDPRRLLERRRRARALVTICGKPRSESRPDGSVATEQVARVVLPRAELDRIWSPEYLERLARTYWRFLIRVSLGLLRVLYTESSREIVLIGRPLVLLRFHAPEYEAEGHRGTVTWRIRDGLLVMPRGRGKGFLRISVERPPEESEDARGAPDDLIAARVSSAVSFYPVIVSWGWPSRIGLMIYRITQLQVHIVVTNAFLLSLARLDLARSAVGALRPPTSDEAAPDDSRAVA